MAAKIVVPELGESVLEATVGHWRKKEGERVGPGEVVVELETDKVDLEVGSEHPGVLAKIERKEGEDVRIGDILGIVEEVAPAAETAQSDLKAQTDVKSGPTVAASITAERPEGHAATAEDVATPSARRLARERGVDLARVPVPENTPRVTRESVSQLSAPAVAETAVPAPSVPGPQAVPLRREDRVRMSRRRMTIARRLVEAQHTAAILTTFNEVDMSGVMNLRRRQKEAFKQRYGVSLGIVSFFVKASIAALKQFPRLNAEIQGEEIVFKHYYDIGVAVGAEEGLVVPVLRDADRLSFAEIESAIKDYARKAQQGTLALADLRGGTFSVTNGGVFGSLLSTPILNPPQAAILGLHKIQERPVAADGAVALRPMMYVALSYDHRLVDGLEAVQFLVRVKEFVEEPATLLLET